VHVSTLPKEAGFLQEINAISSRDFPGFLFSLVFRAVGNFRVAWIDAQCMRNYDEAVRGKS
jgi:hypothetical protein